MGKIHYSILVAIWVAVAVGAPMALAKTSLDVSLGFAGAYRASRWTPVFITASDDFPRNVEIEVYAPHDLIHGMRIRQTVAITPSPATFVIYVPMPSDTTAMGVTLRDAGSKRRLAFWDAEEAMRAGMWSSQAVQRLVGVSGVGGAVSVVERQLYLQNLYTLSVRPVPPIQLPTSAIGLDSLDALMLDEPDLARMTPEQQSAIIAWVRSGGRLVCWLGPNAIANGSEIVANLPAGIGDNISANLSEDAVRKAGLPPRFRALKARQLAPAPDAEKIDLFSGELAAYRRTLGFGSVTVLPMNPSTLAFNGPDASLAFWRAILGRLVPEPEEKTRTSPSLYSELQQNEAQAASVLMDQLGSVPGAGSFGFSYVVVVMIGMMLIVGPLDWIVLKKLNRQPWTWVTTTGWIALVTFGAIYLGHVYKSGDLHFRTVQLIDQADGFTQARIDAAGIYSPRTQDYSLKVDPEGWWEPLSADIYYRGSRTKLNTLAFHQDRRGTRAEPMQVNVWNLEFLRSTTIETTQPMIAADLHVERRGQVDHLVGTVTNLSDRGLTNVMLQHRRMAGRAANIAASATASVDVTLDSVAFLSSYAERLHTQRAAIDPEKPKENELIIEPIWGIASRRNDRLDELLPENDSLACVYAASDGVAPQLEIESPGAIPMHRRYIRALVKLSKGQP